MRKWYLPFKNMSGKTGYLIFEEKNEEIEWSKSSIETSQYYDMKVREGKYEGIILDEVEEEIYCNSAAYGFKFAYIKMKDGREYVIPFISENVSEWNSLVCKKIYTVQEFFTIMYRYYDEPTLEELIEQSETMDNTTTGISYFREVPLGKNTVLPGSPSKRTELKEKNINIGLINPPYSQKDVAELEFDEHLLDILTTGGTGVVVVPMSCAIGTKFKDIRERLMKKNTLRRK